MVLRVLRLEIPTPLLELRRASEAAPGAAEGASRGMDAWYCGTETI